MHYNILIQVTNLLLAVSASFILPLALGIDLFGDLISIIAFSALVGKVLEAGIDTVSINIFSIYKPRFNYLLELISIKIFLVSIVYIVYGLLIDREYLKIEFFYTLSLTLNSLFFSLSYPLLQKKTLFKILFFLFIIYLAILVFFFFINQTLINIIFIMSFYNFLSIAILYGILHKILIFEKTRINFKRIKLFTYRSFHNILATSYNLFLNVGLVFIFSFIMDSKNIGLFRISISLVQAATSIMFVNVKIFFSEISQVKRKTLHLYVDSFILKNLLIYVPLMIIVFVFVKVFNIYYSELISNSEIKVINDLLIYILPTVVLTIIMNIYEKTILSLYIFKELSIVNIIYITFSILVFYNIDISLEKIMYYYLYTLFGYVVILHIILYRKINLQLKNIIFIFIILSIYSLLRSML